jgi:two-component system, OmpR family, sensor kinase
VSEPSELSSVAARIWASRWPELAWVVFALGNLCWMVFVPSWSMLPYHITWMSLLLLYGLGIRSWSKVTLWCLVTPVMIAVMLIFADPAIRGRAPYDEIIELPVMLVLLFAMRRLTNHRMLAMRDLDAVSRHNAELLEKQRDFVQNASHELRTPITVALAHAELVKRSSSARTLDDVEVVIDELGRLRRIVDELLTLATAEQKTPASQTPTSVAPLVREALRRWAVVQRTWVIPHLDDAVVLIDPHRLAAALDALMDNAARFTREGDRIELSVRRVGDEVAVTVADAGPGIPDDELASVFERFKRGGPASTDECRHGAPRNFGLGLAIVDAVARANGGHVDAARSGLGGAALTVWLPLADVGVAETAGSGVVHAAMPGTLAAAASG